MDDRARRAAHRIQGRSAAPGIALGALVLLSPVKHQARQDRSTGEEHQALVDALAASQQDLIVLAGEMKDPDAEAILAFQIAMLEDENLAAPAFARIETGEVANRAWHAAIDPEIASYEEASDPYFRARASDLRDLRDRVLRRGSPSSHVAILARSRGVPMIVGVELDPVENGRDAVLDADAGLLIVDPDPDMRAAYGQRRAEQAELRQAAVSFVGPVLTAVGEAVQVMINVTGLAELGDIDPAGVDGIGLMRTEFLFQGREKLPTEEEQYQIYRRMVEWAAGKPVTIRTLDAGGDKPVAGLTQPGDLNPFLGVRGVRLSLRHREVFREQLRALLRAAVAGNLKVMIPMVEVPAAALTIEDFAADFFSIGSNDLIQYVMAASRDEPQLADLARPSRAVFDLIGRVVGFADRSGREASLCGDLAGEPAQVAALLDRGLRIFSVAPGALGPVKAAIARYRGPS